MGRGCIGGWGWNVKGKRLLAGVSLALVVLMGRGVGQGVIKNPTGYQFTCPDHAGDDAHDLAIIRESDGVTVQTLALGDPLVNAQGLVVGALNVQPLAFGAYRARVRAVGNGIASDWSEPTAVWERAPGKPGGFLVQ